MTKTIKGTFHVRMGTIKNRNNKDLTEAEEIKQKRLRRNGNNTQKNYTRKVLMSQKTTMVWSHT